MLLSLIEATTKSTKVGCLVVLRTGRHKVPQSGDHFCEGVNGYKLGKRVADADLEALYPVVYQAH